MLFYMFFRIEPSFFNWNIVQNIYADADKLSQDPPMQFRIF